MKSSLRFIDSNTKQLSAAALLAKHNKQKKLFPSNINITSMYDIFSSDEGTYSPGPAHLSTINVAGRALSFKELTTAIASVVGGETGSKASAMALSEYFARLADQLANASDMIEENTARNHEIRHNNSVVEDLKQQYELQYAHEQNLDAATVTLIEADEQKAADSARISALEAQVAAFMKDASAKTNKLNNNKAGVK